MRYIWLIPLLPGLGAAINGIVGIRWFSRKTAGVVAVTTMTAALALSLVAFWQLLGLSGEARAYDVNVADWIPQIPLATRDGIFLISSTFGTLDFRAVQNAAGTMAVETAHFGVLSFICLFLFVGATGKSAQIPLYVWLPDAMEGPTPVSALIHAATMVTAGVYMLGRNAVLFSQAPQVMTIVAIVGVLTALMAASIGLVQYDIKRVLAYSTVSQLGYMFTAMGVGAFSAGAFHLMTHAFFKALLFLCSGSGVPCNGGGQEKRAQGRPGKPSPGPLADTLVVSLVVA